MMDAFLGSYSGKLEAVSGDLGVDVSEIAANNSSTLGLEAVAVKTVRKNLFHGDEETVGKESEKATTDLL